MDYLRRTGDYVEFAVHVPTAGDYVLDFRYANGGSSDRPLELKLNGAVARPSLSFAPTGSWSEWRTVSAVVPLVRGANTIRLSATGRGGPNLDALTVSPRAAAAVSYLSQSRSVSGELSEHFDVVDPDTGQVVEDHRQAGDSRVAPDFREFNGAISVRVEPPPGWTSGLVSATQHSRLTEAGVFIDGQVDSVTGTDRGAYSAKSDVDVTFELSQPRAYVLNYTIVLDTSALPRVTMSLARVGGETLFEVMPFKEPITGPTGTRSGTLGAGRYRFVMSYAIGGDVGSHGPYTVELSLNP